MRIVLFSVMLLLVNGCGPDFGNPGEAPKFIHSQGNCKVKVVEIEDIKGFMCPEAKLAMGIVRVSPAIIRCGKVDAEC